jgi:Polysaccharide deacetylase
MFATASEQLPGRVHSSGEMSLSVRSATMLAMVALALAMSACATDLTDTDDAYETWAGQRVLCGIGIDGNKIPVRTLEAGMRRARDRGEVLILFAHIPGQTIARDRVDDVLAAADRVGLPYVTFPELADPAMVGKPGLAFGFDDYSVDAWYGLRDLFQAHAARITFFVSNYGDITAAGHAELRALAGDGHAIEAHGMGHRDAADYVDEHGLSAYLADEIDPMLSAMAADGFHPTTFAYPFGDRTQELDIALLHRFQLLRSVTYLDKSLINSAPCPR